jgi:hypothetical protein
MKSLIDRKQYAAALRSGMAYLSLLNGLTDAAVVNSLARSRVNIPSGSMQ